MIALKMKFRRVGATAFAMNLVHMLRCSMAAVAIALLIGSSGTPRAERSPVGTALVLLVDVSGSIDDREYILQRDGIAQAFRDPAVAEAIRNQPYGAMAVTLIEWSSSETVVAPWTIVHDKQDTARFANMVASVNRSSSGATCIGDAIVFALAALDECACRPVRRVIDVSGDGIGNGGRIGVDNAREMALAAGITINGLPILDPTEDDVAPYYRDRVIGGTGSFIVEANGFEDFTRALRHKLILEIAQVRP
jgi:Protein of unknown function (DUF1194)